MASPVEKECTVPLPAAEEKTAASPAEKEYKEVVEA